jgi:hypothetical protein
MSSLSYRSTPSMISGLHNDESNVSYSYWMNLETYAKSSLLDYDLSAPSVAKFIVPNWAGKVNSGIVLSYWPARLQAGRPVRQRYAGVNYISHSGTMNFATA